MAEAVVEVVEPVSMAWWRWHPPRQPRTWGGLSPKRRFTSPITGKLAGGYGPNFAMGCCVQYEQLTVWV